jgi:alkylation response protein AidB-like acyl-CoA dehydrogenase
MTVSTIAEREEIRAMAREVARREIAPRAAALDEGGHEAFAECWAVLVELGLDRALLPERHGGSELAVPDLLGAIEELAVGDGGIAMSVLLSNAALSMLSDEQLQDVRAGARCALVPAASGSEATVRDGKIDGRIECALGARGTDGLVVLLDAAQPEAWVVDTDANGVMIEPDLSQMGLRAAPAASIELEGAPCAPADPAGALALLRAGTAAIAYGIARHAHDAAYEYAEARNQGGVAIIEHDAVSDMLTAMEVRIRCSPTIAPDTTGEAGGANGAARRTLDEAQALAVKIAATDAALATATDAVQVFGGTGYMVETGIEKLMRDALWCKLFPEPNWVAHGELMRARRGRNGRAGTSVVSTMNGR